MSLQCICTLHFPVLQVCSVQQMSCRSGCVKINRMLWCLVEIIVLLFPPPLNLLYFQIAWALNKGVKTEYKQFWDADLGVSYIPWEKVKLDNLDGFAEGGMIDQETVNSGKNNLKLFVIKTLFLFFHILFQKSVFPIIQICTTSVVPLRLFKN